MPNSEFVLPKVENTQIIFDKGILKVRCDTLKLANGHTYPYYTLLARPAAVAVLVIALDGSYYFNEEYRHPTGKILLSCPGGFLDEGESPVEGAKRELLEETGLEAESFKVIGKAYPYAGISSQHTYFVLARGAKPFAPPNREPAEIMRTIKKTKKELLEAIEKGAELDGQLCSALFFETL